MNERQQRAIVKRMTDMDERQRQDAFVEVMGSTSRADAMDRLYQGCYGGYSRTKKTVFIERAEERGYSKTEIAAFLAL